MNALFRIITTMHIGGQLKSITVVCMLLVTVPATSVLAQVPELGRPTEQEEASASDVIQTSLPAEELQPSPTAGGTPAPIINITRTSDRVKELQQLYQALTEDYQTKYREYTVAKGQWQSLQTLRSLEEALQATQAVYISRDRLYITYYEILFEMLSQTPGIELTLKTPMLDALTARINKLKEHQAALEQTVEREPLNQSGDVFTKDYLGMKDEIERTLVLIKMGRLQTTIDKADSLYIRIKDRNGTLTDDQRKEVERQRAYKQVEVVRKEISAGMLEARDGLSGKVLQRVQQIKTYNQYAGIIDQSYADTSQYLSYLHELARDDW